MNKLTQIIGNDANVADGTFSPKLNAGAVRNPYECIACDGKGVIRGFATLDPSARRREVDCLRCGGTGHEPEPEKEEEE